MTAQPGTLSCTWTIARRLSIRLPMDSLRFVVFGKVYLVQREGDRWQVYATGADGKRRPAGFVIPDFIGEHEMVEYLHALFHESATPGSGDVRRLE